MIIKKLDLKVAPQGGFYAETFRSDQAAIIPSCPPAAGQGSAFSAGSSYYYLLEGTQSAAWHRIPCDQTWTFHHGGSEVIMYMIDEKTSKLWQLQLGNILSRSPTTKTSISLKAGTIVAAQLIHPNSYALVTIHNFPAYSPTQVQLQDTKRLQRMFPGQRDVIQKIDRV